MEPIVTNGPTCGNCPGRYTPAEVVELVHIIDRYSSMRAYTRGVLTVERGEPVDRFSMADLTWCTVHRGDALAAFLNEDDQGAAEGGAA